MKTLKMILATILLLISGATSAHAIGDVERGALIGAGAMLLVPALFGSNRTTYVEPRREVIYYVQPRTTVVYREPYYERERVVIINDNYPRHRPYYREYDRHPSYHPDRYYYGR